MNFRFTAIAVVVLPLAVALAPAVESAETLADTGFSGAKNVRVYRGIEQHPNYRPAGRSGIRIFRGQPNEPSVAPTSPRPTVTHWQSSATPVPSYRFLAGPGARVPYPYWPRWRQTNISTHCAPRWMC